MQVKVSGENSFKCLKNTFSVGATTQGYTLAYSADDVNFTNYTQPTPAGETLIVYGVTPYTFFKLSGNTDNDVNVVL